MSVNGTRRREVSAELLVAALTRDVHMMCVGSVTAVVGSSPKPTGKASKCFLKKTPLETHWRQFDAFYIQEKMHLQEEGTHC